MPKILHLTLKKEFFDAIAMGEKTIEQRKDTLYWRRRLMKNHQEYIQFDEVHFRNGYTLDRPFMRVRCSTTLLNRTQHGNEFLIFLGDILEIKNWKDDKCHQ